jgi:imidazolonepropionase-like amidohydrolase
MRHVLLLASLLALPASAAEPPRPAKAFVLKASRLFDAKSGKLVSPEQTLAALPLARATLMAGFTTVRNLGAADFIDVGLRNGIRRGDAVGPRLLVSTSSLGSTGGHCDSGNSWRKGLLAEESSRGVANSPDAFRAKVRENFKYGADLIKVCATGGVLSRNDDVDSPQLTQAELDAIIDEAHARKRKVAAHAHGAEGAKRAIRAGVDSIEHGSFLDDEALELMKQKGTWYVPTALALQGVVERADKGQLPPELARKARTAATRHRETLRKAIPAGCASPSARTRVSSPTAATPRSSPCSWARA